MKYMLEDFGSESDMLYVLNEVEKQRLEFQRVILGMCKSLGIEWPDAMKLELKETSED